MISIKRGSIIPYIQCTANNKGFDHCGTEPLLVTHGRLSIVTPARDAIMSFEMHLYARSSLEGWSLLRYPTNSSLPLMQVTPSEGAVSLAKHLRGKCTLGVFSPTWMFAIDHTDPRPGCQFVHLNHHVKKDYQDCLLLALVSLPEGVFVISSCEPSEPSGRCKISDIELAR